MKKFLGFMVATGFVMLVATAWAGLPSINTGSSTVNSAVNKGLDTAKNKAFEDDINNQVKKQLVNCGFKKGKDAETTCDLDKIFGTIKSKKAPFEALGLASVYVRVKANNYNRAHYVEQFGEGSLGNWWKISSSTNSTMGDKIEITVKSY